MKLITLLNHVLSGALVAALIFAVVWQDIESLRNAIRICALGVVLAIITPQSPAKMKQDN